MTTTAPETGTTVALSISGMTCGGCASTITDALTALPGVTSAVVSHEKAHAVVQLAAGADAEGFAFDADAAIHDAGYTLEAAEALTTVDASAGPADGGCGGDCACGADEATAATAPKDEAGCCGGGGCC